MRPVLTLLALLCGLVLTATARTPNVVLILADDFSHPDASVYGGQAATPRMERLAREGMLFTRTFQAAPMCSPTRHALYTGLYPVRSGAWPNHTFVYDGVRSLAHYWSEQGVRAGFTGKTHINPLSAFPFEFLSEAAKNKNPDFAAVDRFLGECVAARQPFGLILASNEPHTPWDQGDPSAYPPDQLQLPPVLVDTPATRANFSKYLAEVTVFDRQVGEALDLLDKHGLADNTLVIVLTEQGNAFPFAKWTCYDVGVGSGMIVRWPGHVAPGSRSDALVEYIDIVPTLLAAAGLPVPADLDGRSFLPVLTGATNRHKEVVFSLHSSVGINNGPGPYGIRSARDERYRYVRNLQPQTTFSNYATRQDWWQEWLTAAAAGDPDAVVAVRRYTTRPAEELYDSLRDPWNRHNLAADPAYAAVKQRLAAATDAWMAAQGDTGIATEHAASSRLWRASSEQGGIDP